MQNNINKVSNRYVRIHKNLQGDTTEFSAEDEKMLIHGGINYEDNGGIDLYNIPASTSCGAYIANVDDRFTAI